MAEQQGVRGLRARTTSQGGVTTPVLSNLPLGHQRGSDPHVCSPASTELLEGRGRGSLFLPTVPGTRA